MIFRSNDKTEFFTDERCFITEVMNTPDIAHVSIAKARVEPQVTTALHQVAVDEIYYILEGQGYVEINGTTKEQLNKGDIAFIKAGYSQRITNTSDVDLIFLCVCTPRFSPEVYTSLE